MDPRTAALPAIGTVYLAKSGNTRYTVTAARAVCATLTVECWAPGLRRYVKSEDRGLYRAANINRNLEAGRWLTIAEPLR